MIDGMNDLIDWLNAQLKARDWTNSKLAQKSGLAPSTISMVLSDRASPGWDFCKGVARAFGVPAEQVFRRAGLLPPRAGSSEGEEQLLYHFEQLTATDQELAIAMLETMAERRTEYVTGEGLAAGAAAPA